MNNDKAILTCALTGVLTNPQQHPVPVTPEQMAAQARQAFDAGASIMHVHIRSQQEGMGHMPSWDPDVAQEVVDAIRQACPGVIINLTTGVVGMLKPEMGLPEYNLVMGVASGMPCDARLLELLPEWMVPNAVWQATLIGRQEIWPVHQKTADLGGMLRTGLEDTFYLPDGSRATGNGMLIEALAQCAHNAGRAIASPAEARQMLGLKA